ncbi:YdaS family helix-turn-helix protein [Maritalea porphyrae]|uniref:YdaS family helix-turn-helix protein n=1 Tax=Maritalea porphyrae TaxID=880732 RepID=UPI0022AF9B1B|nr:YdaS family helix-turn-helix protein [Maritalea porphyrae]MCZ4270763.1 YdaS family helix-turn-helix protein [Maritalea porphyrae]
MSKETTFDLQKAIKAAGGPVKLSRFLGCISSQAISAWVTCPPARVPRVSRFIGVPMETIRPDLYDELETEPANAE